MNSHRRAILVTLLALSVSLVATLVVIGQSGGGYDLFWQAIAGGGGRSSGGPYTVMDTLGQVIASHDVSNSGQQYTLTDGFWQPGLTERRIYLPVVIAP